MATDDEDLPPCFGDLEKVFPMKENGLRETPKDCYFYCPVKTRCLKQAMAGKDGTKVEEELIDRGAKAGVMNFFERWSRKKQVHRKQQKFKS